MKKLFFATFLAAVCLAGCQTELSDDLSQTDESVVFNAVTEVFDAATKTSMTPDRNVVWTAGDHIAIFQACSIADKYAVSDASAGSMNGTFSLVTDESGAVNGDFNAGNEIATNVALYPYATGLSCEMTAIDGAYNIKNFNLPAIQTYAAGSFGNGSFPMIAVTETMADHNLKFKNVCGAMKLSFKGTKTIKSIKVEGNNGEKLSGAAAVTAYSNGTVPALTMSDEASTCVTLDCGETGVTLSESSATDFIIALPPVLFSQGFAVKVTCSDETIKTIETTTANTVLRSSILTMPTLVLADDVTEDEEGDTDSSIKVLDIAFDKSTLTLAPSTSYSLITIVVPDTAEDKTLTWSSSAPTVATVDQSGVVTAVSDGTATITAVAVGGASKSCTVNVISVPTSVATKDYIDEYGVNHGKGIAIGGTVWAPVNCGYKAPTYDAGGSVTDKGFPYGKLYQWGRKYGQGYSADYDSEPATYPGPVSAVFGQDASMAGYFFIDSSDWIETRDKSMWNSGTEDSPVKTVNDPCPEGWRVPTYAELNALQTDYSEWTSKDDQNGYYFSGVSTTVYDTAPLIEDKAQVFFPAAGYRNYGGSASTRGNDGSYWASRPDSDYAYGLRFYNGNATMDNGYRAYGYSVRCVQN